METPRLQRVFISHASEDAEAARRLCTALESRGLACWIAPRDIPPGHEYQVEIIEAIEQSACMVVLVSRASNESPFVKNEVERAFTNRKRLYPVRLEDVRPAKHLEFFLAACQWIDMKGSRVAAAAAILAASMGGEQHLVVPAAPASGRGRAAAILAGALALAIAMTWLIQHNRPTSRGETTRGTVPPSPATRGEPLRYHAVVIGINTYSGGDDGWAPLRTASADATALADLLEKNYGFQVRRVLDRDATAKGILAALDDLSRLDARDAALVFFAGHGFYDEAQKEGFWIPADARKSAGGRLCREDWIWNSVLAKMVEASPARHILVIADSCFSSSLLAEATSVAAAGSADAGAPSRYLIASGGLEPVPDGNGAHSLFMRALLSRLEQAGGRTFSAPDLARELRPALAAQTGQVVHGGPLRTPVDEGGAFVFAPLGSAVPAVSERTIAPPPAGGDREAALRTALTLARGGATATAQRVVAAWANADGGDALARAVAGYLDRDQQAKRGEALRALVKQIADHRTAAAGQPGRDFAGFARPRIIACLGPVLKGPGLASDATLYQIALREQLQLDPTLRAMERESLESVLTEQNLIASGMTDARANVALGRLLPASLILAGDLLCEDAGDTIFVRLVDTETGQIVHSVTTERKPGETVASVCAALATNLAAAARKARPLEALVFERRDANLLAGIGSFHGARAGGRFALLERVSRPVATTTVTMDAPRGTARIGTLGDVASELQATWEGPPPATNAVLWIRETAD